MNFGQCEKVDKTSVYSGLEQPDAIVVFVLCDGEKYELYTYPNEYRSLMHLIYDKINPGDFGECLGMGKCGTCLIKILKSRRSLSYYERNEESALRKLTTTGESDRLACQVIADENIDGLEIKILS